MKLPLLARVFGANYKTFLTGAGAGLFSILTMLAALPYQLGEVATFIPPAWKSKVFVGAAVAAFILRMWNAYVQKDKDVHGGTIIQDNTGGAIKIVPQGTEK